MTAPALLIADMALLSDAQRYRESAAGRHDDAIAAEFASRTGSL